MTGAWQTDWDHVVAMVGQDMFTKPEHRSWGSPYGDVVWGADPIEAGTLRRYLEPLEFESGIHCDRAVAQTEGYTDLVLPMTAMLSFSAPPIWRPGGGSVFVGNGRNDQPGGTGEGSYASFPVVHPRYASYFGTDFEISVVRPAVVGEWLGRHGSRVVSVVPKETAVGRGAFFQWEVEVVTKQMELIGKYRPQMFIYEPMAGR